MNIISGQNVDLLTPFPTSEAHRLFGWNHCYRSLSDDDEIPQEKEGFEAWARELLPLTLSFGVIDKGQVTTQKHEAPLVGILMLRAMTHRMAALDFAAGRKAFKMGLVDEGVTELLQWMWGAYPLVMRVTTLLEEGNTPAKGLLRRLGFKFEGVLRDSVLRDGIARNQAIFGLIRPGVETPSVDTPEAIAPEGETA